MVRKIYSQKTELVGIITGDVQINEEAPILIMTTEILRNRLFKGGIEDLGYVIFDEIHYFNDKERGIVWEESIIQLKNDVTMLFLSATISNPLEFSEWIGRIKNRTIHVIKTNKRVIPLKYIFFTNDEFFDINKVKIPELNSIEPKKSIRIPVNYKSRNIKPVFSIALFIQKIKMSSLPTIFFCFSRNKCDEYLNICSSNSYIHITERRKIEKFLEENNIRSDYKKY